MPFAYRADREEQALKRFMRGLLVAAVLTTGTVAVAATPAFALGGCNHDNPTVGPCIDWQGHDSDPVTADFYLNKPPDDGLYYYRFAINVNGIFYWVQNDKTRLDHMGRYTKPYWYRNTSDPFNTTKTAYSEVIIYTKAGGVHMTVDSPKIVYRN